MQVSKIICRMCRMSCGLNLYLENGSIVYLTGMQEHFRNALCVKPFAISELIDAPNRLKNPMIKKDGVQQKSTWDEAFELAASKLKDIKNKYGAQAVVTHTGQSYVGTLSNKMPKRFCDLFGTPNFTTGGSLCFLSEIVAYRSTGLPLACPSYSPSTKLMIYWGLNPGESAPIDRDKALSLKARGAKLIIIDPRRTDLAKIADMHIQHRPGTDCALALGLLNVVIHEGLYDKDFTENWTYGFDELVDHVKKYTPETVEKITWVPAKKIIDLARSYAEHKPGFISMGISLEDSSNGVQAMRALITLMGIVGNLDVPGGNIVPSPPFKQTDLGLPDKATKIQGIGADYPLFTEFTGEQQMSRLLDQILNDDPYPIRALIVGGSDIFLSWPNTNKLKKAMEKLEFLLVIDCFMNETVRHADVVLPSKMFVERNDCRDYRPQGINLFAISSKAIESPDNAKEDWEIWSELGKRLGYEEYFPWENSDELLQFLLKDSNYTMEEVKRRPGGIFYSESNYKKYLKQGFLTPSKKLEIYSQILKKHGYDPLPTFHEPMESPVRTPEIAQKFPFIAITGARSVAYLGSQYRQSPSLKKIDPRPVVEINTSDAEQLKISTGDMVEVRSLRGKIEIEAKVTDDILPKIVSIPKGWGQANANFLTSDEFRDPNSGFPDYRVVMCSIKKI